MNEIIDSLQQIDPKACITTGEPMALHTSFKVGGSADVFVLPGSVEGLIKAVELCRLRGQEFQIIGKGSNLLISDDGVRGVVFATTSLRAVHVMEGALLRAEAGISLAALAGLALDHGLTGLEFAAGIPGSLGGAITMNAGAYGGEMKQVIRRVRLLDAQGLDQWVDGAQLEFGYRHSILQERELIALEAELALAPGDPEAIREQMAQLAAKRREKQPLEYPSAGSTFKRPVGYYAGKLIQDAGLAGFCVGDAQVSEKHCGFVINRGAASAQEIWLLCREVQRRVKDQFGVELELEPKLIGKF